jgi:hypothetical protein
MNPLKYIVFESEGGPSVFLMFFTKKSFYKCLLLDFPKVKFLFFNSYFLIKKK